MKVIRCPEIAIAIAKLLFWNSNKQLTMYPLACEFYGAIHDSYIILHCVSVYVTRSAKTQHNDTIWKLIFLHQCVPCT